MAKISTYAAITSPASLNDMLIGTNVINNNETENFKLSQVLSLYPLITQKASLTSTVNQTAVINTPTTVTFNTAQFSTSGITPLPIGGPIYTGIQIGNDGYYLIEAAITILGAGAGADVSAWLKVNANNIGPASIHSVVGAGYTTLKMSWIYNFAAADVASIDWQTTNINASLASIAAGVARPIVPSAQITISQV